MGRCWGGTGVGKLTDGPALWSLSELTASAERLSGRIYEAVGMAEVNENRHNDQDGYTGFTSLGDVFS